MPVDKDKFNKQEMIYAINKTVEMDEQKIYIDKLTIYPTISVLDISYDKSNTMKIFSIQDIKIGDSDHEWDNGVDGCLGAYPDEFTSMLYFESNYFMKDKKDMYVSGSGIRCIEKEKQSIIVDMQKSELLKSPDNKLQLKEIMDNSNNFEIVLNYAGEKISFDFEFKDSNGDSFDINSIGYTQGEDRQEIFYRIPKRLKFKSSITLNINDYSNIIEKPFKINVMD